MTNFPTQLPNRQKRISLPPLPPSPLNKQLTICLETNPPPYPKKSAKPAPVERLSEAHHNVQILPCPSAIGGGGPSPPPTIFTSTNHACSYRNPTYVLERDSNPWKSDCDPLLTSSLHSLADCLPAQKYHNITLVLLHQ